MKIYPFSPADEDDGINEPHVRLDSGRHEGSARIETVDGKHYLVVPYDSDVMHLAIPLDEVRAAIKTLDQEPPLSYCYYCHQRGGHLGHCRRNPKSKCFNPSL